MTDLQIRSQLALLIVDMQNGFCHADGTFGKMGLPVSRLLTIIPAIHKLRKIAHAKDLPVFYTRMGFNANYSDAGITLDRQTIIKDLKGFMRGTWDAEILDELTPDMAKGEVVIDKTRNTAFWHTDLMERLVKLGIDQLIVTGVGTQVCVESTVRDAYTNGYDCIVVEDATATLSDEEHDASLKAMTWFGQRASLEQVETALKDEKK